MNGDLPEKSKEEEWPSQKLAIEAISELGKTGLALSWVAEVKGGSDSLRHCL